MRIIHTYTFMHLLHIETQITYVHTSNNNKIVTETQEKLKIFVEHQSHIGRVSIKTYFSCSLSFKCKKTAHGKKKKINILPGKRDELRFIPS